jgi:hypothetical protein
MNSNFGIGFYLFDGLFHTIAKRHRPLNWAGYQIARQRYRLNGTHGVVAVRSGSDCGSTGKDDSRG